MDEAKARRLYAEIDALGERRRRAAVDLATLDAEIAWRTDHLAAAVGISEVLAKPRCVSPTSEEEPLTLAQYADNARQLAEVMKQVGLTASEG